MYLFLDDERDPYKVKHVVLPTASWTIVRNYDEFVRAIETHYQEYKKLPTYISWDHDLAASHYRESMYNPDRHYNEYYATFKEKTGYCCAKWLVQFCIDRNLEMCEYGVHSMNPIGKENIEGILECYKSFRAKNHGTK